MTLYKEWTSVDTHIEPKRNSIIIISLTHCRCPFEESQASLNVIGSTSSCSHNFQHWNKNRIAI